MPGLLPTIGYLDLQQFAPDQLADLIVEKVGSRKREFYLPPEPDLLYALVGADAEEERDFVSSMARNFLEALRRMSDDEKRVVLHAFLLGCPAELPNNVHLAADLLRRYTEFPVSKIMRILGNLRSLGFSSSMREESHEGSEEAGTSPHQVIVLEYVVMRIPDGGNATEVARNMVHGGGRGYCQEHAMEALVRADFSQLSSNTTQQDTHSAPRKRRAKRKRPAG